ncbi:MAG: MoxR family ATPase [Planctomycetes bacterium]|nr:MoxR family ATPase [Planctomycetota bacterium]
MSDETREGKPVEGKPVKEPKEVRTVTPVKASSSDELTDKDLQAAEKLKAAYKSLSNQLARVIVGQDQVIEELLIALFSRGHCILEGVPGLAKTLMISSLSKCLSLDFSRIQFTPDLMPSDITGTEVIEENRSTGNREFKFIAGPLFANMILADEINRTPPKTQAALLEAMQERQVTVGRIRHKLSDPFFVLATQNPIEQEGTYPLPEAQQDRFMFKIFVNYPSFKEEFDIARRTTTSTQEEIKPVLSGEQILDLQRLVRRVPVTDHVLHYTLALVRQTRLSEPGAPKFIKEWLSWGAGPRATQYLILGGKARALLKGRTHVQTEDIQALALPVLRHRILTNFTAASEGVTTDKVIERMLRDTPSKESELSRDERFKKIFAS